MVYLELGAVAKAEASLQQAIDLSRRLGVLAVETSAKYILGIALARRGALGEAFALWSSLLEVAIEVGDRRLECWTRSRISRLLLWHGELEKADHEVRRALKGPSAPNCRCVCLNVFIEVCLARGLVVEAHAAAQETMRLFEQGGDITECQGMTRLNFAEALHAVGDHDAARAAITRARDWLHHRAAKMADLEVRRRFLEDVPEHARIMMLAAEWLGG